MHTPQTVLDSNVRVLRFSPEDADGVLNLIVPIQREEFGIPIAAQDQPDLCAIQQFYQSGVGDFWIAKAGSQIVGTIGLKDIGEGAAALRKMFVAAPWRGRSAGVAAVLLETLLAAACQRDVKRIYLGTTEKFLAAHRFYEKQGFVRISKVDLPESFPLMVVDTRFYALELTPSG